MRTSLILAPVIIVAGVLPAFGQTLTLRPGKYETTAEMNFAGGMKMPPQKDTQCITAEDLKDFSKTLGDPEFAQTCKVSNYRVSANKVTFNTDCKDDDLVMKGTTEMTFTAETFTGVVTMTDNQGRVTTIKTSARRIGECTK